MHTSPYDRLLSQHHDAGHARLDELDAWVRRALDGHGPLSDEQLLGPLRTLHLDDLAERFDLRALELPALWDRVLATLRSNPLLVVLAARTARSGATLPPVDDHRESIVATLAYAAVLHALTEAMVEDEALDGSRPPLAVQVVQRIAAHRDTLDLHAVTNRFERLKLMSLDQALAVESTFKHSPTAFDDIHEFRGVFLMLNVLEAMGQDVLQHHEANARAGFELFAQGTGRPALPGLHNHLARPAAHGSATHLPDRPPPLPAAWSQLYESWNLAFVSSYPNWPMFAAKLLTPAVSEKVTRLPGVYMHYRGMALYLHAHHEVFSRIHRPPPADLRDPALTALWGDVNREAAAAYHAAVTTTLRANNPTSVVGLQAARRAALRLTWLAVSGGVRVARALGV
jgi:hypothetical protein